MGKHGICFIVDQSCVKSKGLPGNLILPLKYWLLDLGGSTHSWLPAPFLGMAQSSPGSLLDFRTAYFRHSCYPVPWSLLFFLSNSLSGSSEFFQLLFKPWPTGLFKLQNWEIQHNKQRKGWVAKVCLHICFKNSKHIYLETKEIRHTGRWLPYYHPEKKKKKRLKLQFYFTNELFLK